MSAPVAMPLPNSDCPLGQRLAAQKGQSDDLVGAMRAEAARPDEEPGSDEE